MNEWILVGIVVVGSAILIGGTGWITSAIRGSRRTKDQ